jgi:hypothetical protein
MPKVRYCLRVGCLVILIITSLKTLIMSTKDAALFFPPAGNFHIESNPIFLIQRNGEREVLVFEAQMDIRTSNAAKNDSGERMVSVEVTDWKAKAYSKLLDCEVGFRITDLGKNSKVTAQNLNYDFPSNLEFNMEYEVLINGEVVKSGLTGVAKGEIHAFPPKPNDMFRVEGKSLKIAEDLEIDVMVCAC